MYYKLEGLLYRTKGNDKDIVSIDKKYKHKNPCIARQQCFSAYMSYLDVLLMSLGKTYENHEQAERDLQDFFVKDKRIVLDELENDFFLHIKLVLNKKEQKDCKDFKEVDGEIMIHSIGSSHQSEWVKEMCLGGLLLEQYFYNLNLYNCNKNLYTKDKKGRLIFKTPIDYSQFEYILKL